MATAAPICVPPPPGVCVTVCPPGCICPAVVLDCGPKAVPTTSLISLGLMIVLIVILALMLGRSGGAGRPK